MQKFYLLASFKLPTKFITGALLWLLPVSASTHPGNSWLTLNLLTTKAEAAQVSSSTSQNIYFPRRAALRRCFVTNPGNCIFKNSDFPTVPDVARDLSRNYRQSAFLAEISVKFSVLGEFNQAKVLTNLITQPLLKVSALTRISEQQVKNGQVKQSQQTLAEALQIAHSAHNFDKIRALTKIAIQYSAIGQQETAAELFNSALQARSKLPNHHIFQNQELLGVAVGLLETGQTAQAEQIVTQTLEDIQKNRIELFISPSILEPLLTAGKYDFTTRLVQKVGVPTYRTRWFSDICLSLVDSGEFDRAIQLASSLPYENYCVKTLSYQQGLANTANSVIDLVKAGKAEMAIAVAQMIPAPHYKVLTLTEIAIALAEAGQAEQSKQVLLQAVELSTISGEENSLVIDYGKGLGKMQIAIRLSESKQFSQALEITETIEEDSYKVLAMLNIVEQYTQNGEKEKALKVLSTTVEIVASLKCKVCG